MTFSVLFIGNYVNLASISQYTGKNFIQVEIVTES